MKADAGTMEPGTAITRQVIYDLVWKEPLTHLSKKFGLSDQGLAKLCKREQIPRPAQGYWNKLAAGKPTGTKPALPVDARCADAVVFRIAAASRSPTTPREEVDQLKVDLPHIRVGERLANPHPVVAERIAFRDAEVREGKKRYDYSAEVWKQISSLDSAERRLLRILDAICKGLETRGAAVGENDRGELVATIGQDKIAFQLRYRMKQVKIPIDPADWRSKLRGKDAFRRGLELTDELICEIKTWMPAGFRRNWREGARCRLEEQAGDVVATMLVAFPVLAARREEREEQGRQFKIREEQRRQHEERQRLNRNRFRRLAELAEASREAALVRDFVAALRDADLDREKMIDDMTVEQWLDWIDAAIADHDPLSRPASIFASIAAVHHRTYPN